MKNSIIATAVSASFVFAGAANAGAVDLFTDPAIQAVGANQLVNSSSANIELSTGPSAFNESGSYATIMGGYRDLYVVTDSTTGPQDGIALVAEQGQLSFATDADVVGRGFVQWDGQDNSSALTKDLIGVDLTAGCGIACDRFITFVDTADQLFPYSIEVWDTEGDWSILTAAVQFPVPADSNVPADYLFEWFNLGNGPQLENGLAFTISSSGVVDFNSIDAMQLILNAQGGAVGQTQAIDLVIGSIETTVPSPAPIALLGLGGLLAGFSMRRRKA